MKRTDISILFDLEINQMRFTTVATIILLFLVWRMLLLIDLNLLLSQMNWFLFSSTYFQSFRNMTILILIEEYYFLTIYAIIHIHIVILDWSSACIIWTLSFLCILLYFIRRHRSNLLSLRISELMSHLRSDNESK